MKTYVLIGAGNRGYWMYADAIQNRYNDVARLVGIMDVNSKRASYVSSRLPGNVPVYTDYNKMMDELEKVEPLDDIIASYGK